MVVDEENRFRDVVERNRILSQMMTLVKGGRRVLQHRLRVACFRPAHATAVARSNEPPWEALIFTDLFQDPFRPRVPQGLLFLLVRLPPAPVLRAAVAALR